MVVGNKRAANEMLDRYDVRISLDSLRGCEVANIALHLVMSVGYGGGWLFVQQIPG